MTEPNGNNSSENVYSFDVDYTCASLARFPASLVKAVVKGVSEFVPYAPPVAAMTLKHYWGNCGTTPMQATCFLDRFYPP